MNYIWFTERSVFWFFQYIRILKIDGGLMLPTVKESVLVHSSVSTYVH